MIILRGTFVKRKINGLNSVNELPNSQFIYTFKQNLRLLGNLKKKKNWLSVKTYIAFSFDKFCILTVEPTKERFCN